MMYNVKNNLYTEVIEMKEDNTIYIERMYDLSCDDLKFILKYLPICGLRSITFSECTKEGWNKNMVNIVCEIIDKSKEQLKYINLSYNKIPHYELLINTLSKCTILETLILDGNYLGEDGLCYLFNKFIGLSHIKMLSVTECHNRYPFKGDWVYHFGEFIALTPSIITVDVNGNGEKTVDQQSAFIKYKRELLQKSKN